jgi:hypothetical protein
MNAILWRNRGHTEILKGICCHNAQQAIVDIVFRREYRGIRTDGPGNGL